MSMNEKVIIVVRYNSTNEKEPIVKTGICNNNVSKYLFQSAWKQTTRENL